MGSRSRLLLVCSLGGLLLLAAASGVAGLVVLGRMRAGETALRARFVARSNALEQIRDAIYLSGTLARDYFADPDSREAPMLTARLAELSLQSRQALERHASSRPGGDPALAGLRAEISGYWSVLGLMGDMARKAHTPSLAAYFRTQLVQRRESMLRIAAAIGVALDSEWRRRESELDSMYNRFRDGLAASMIVVVLGGLAVSMAAIRRLTRLERQARDLSTQLVQMQEQERRAIARELHDEIGQSMTTLLLELGAALSLSTQDALRARLETVVGLGERIVEELRRIALSLRPSMLDDLGLVPALEWQAREVGQRSGLNVEVVADENDGQLPEAYRTCIYRVVQEALQNCVRHAGARKVRIGLRKDSSRINLEVGDDGKGFNVARTRGLGLLGMEERVSHLGGRLRVLSEPGHGTVVTAELPL